MTFSSAQVMRSVQSSIIYSIVYGADVFPTEICSIPHNNILSAPPVAIAGEVFVLVACVRYDVCYQYNTTRKRLHMYTVSQKKPDRYD